MDIIGSASKYPESKAGGNGSGINDLLLSVPFYSDLKYYSVSNVVLIGGVSFWSSVIYYIVSPLDDFE